MKKNKENQILLSPTDLKNFTQCKYLTKNDILFTKEEGKGKELKKSTSTGDLKLVMKKGDEHERKHLNLFKDKYSNYKILYQKKKTEKEQFRETVAAIKEGKEMINQAFLMDDDGKFRGYADFLIKVNTESDLGPWSYEVYDTKIARNPKPLHVLQIASYSEMLGKIQGSLPKEMHLIAGNDKTHTYKVNEFIDYFIHNKKICKNFVDNYKNENIYPEKCDHCKICHWKDECEKEWEHDDYINQIAGIISSQIEKFKKEKIVTTKKLAEVNLDKIDLKINPKTLSTLKIKANLIQERKKTNEIQHEFIDTEPDKGFYKLPKPNPADIFFDIEGYPFYGERGFEYLHGLYLNTGKKMEFKYFWAKELDQSHERENFKKLIEYLQKHFEKNPDAYLYHYNVYEKTALKNLSNDFSTVYPNGLHFVDQLLRLEKFVDLFRVVDQCMLTSEKDNSLKTIEKFYEGTREANIKSASESIVLYDQWLETQNDNLKQDIINYNKEDCISTFKLREFLLDKKEKHYREIPFFSKSEEEKAKHRTKKPSETGDENLLNKLEAVKNENNKEYIDDLKNLIGFYSREDKPTYWAMYDREQKEHDDLIDDTECIANCIRTADPPKKIDGIINKKGTGKTMDKFHYKYKFPKQDYKFQEGGAGVDILGTKKSFKIEKITEKNEHEYLTVSLTSGMLKKIESMPNLMTLGPEAPYSKENLKLAIDKYINSFLNDKTKNKYKALNSLLKNELPDIKNFEKGKNLIDEKKDFVEESIKVVQNLNSSFLVIQGPPGTGKTWISAKIIIELLKQNKKIGISSLSHKAINNLLLQIEKISLEEKFKFKGIKINSAKSEGRNNFEGKTSGTEKELIKNTTGHSMPEDCLLVAATTYAFAYRPSLPKVKGEKSKKGSPVFDQNLDYIFVDEAGQVSLASTIAIGLATKNLILIGDQMQLAQPIKGIHAGNAGKSGLEFLLKNQDTIPYNRGIFLKETRRLDKKICDFISESFYESRLKPHEITKKRKVNLNLKNFESENIYYIPIDHKGCSTGSDEEVDLINKIYEKILGSNYTDEHGNGKIDYHDMMTIAPFNVQVGKLMKKLNTKSKIGTVDKLQGQEGKVVFISYTASDSANIPRHKTWFFSRNRLNVAISRAQSIVFVIFNPNLLLASCKKIEEMKLLNNFCKLIKFKTIL